MISYKFCVFSDNIVDGFFNDFTSFEDFKENCLLHLYLYIRNIANELQFVYSDNNGIEFNPLARDRDYDKAKVIEGCVIAYVVPIKITLSPDTKTIADISNINNDCVVLFNSHNGIDTKFSNDIDNFIRSYLATTEEVTPYLKREHLEDLYELTERNLIEIGIRGSIYLRKAKAYSSIDLKEIQCLFKWADGLTINNYSEEIVYQKRINSSKLKDKVNALTLSHDLRDKVDITIKMLECLRKLNIDTETHCYSEANRRMIIDILLLVGLQVDENIKILINAELHMKGHNDVTTRVGNGPLDYFVKIKNELIVVTVPSVENVENISTLVGLSSTNDVVGDASFDDYINSDHVVIEAKIDIDVSNFSRVLGQLVAQMLDGLGSLTTTQGSLLRKRSADDASMMMTNSISSASVDNHHLCRCVKGILSTGHHNMFFTLSQSIHDDSKPVLHYYGDYKVDVLKKIKGYRESCGLHEKAPIARQQVESFLKALFCFVTFD